MDTWIIAEDVAFGARIAKLLKGQGFECPPARILEIASVGPDARPLAGFSGIVFLGVNRLEASHFELLRRLRAAVEPEAKLAVVSCVADPGTVLKAVRAGANDLLVTDDRLEEEFANFIANVRQQGRQKEARGRVLTIVPCQNPGDANILATNMSAVIATRIQSCGLLDFHFRGGDLALLLKLAPRHTILDLFNQTDTFDDTMFRQALSTHESGIQLLAGPTSFGDLRSIRLQTCQQIISLAQRCWPAVIINSEDIQHAEQIRALAVSDEVILTMRLDIPALHHTQKHIEFLTQCQVSRDRIHVVAMGTGHHGELPLSSVKKLLQTHNIHCVPDDPSAILMSVNIGNPIVLESPKAKPSVAIQMLTDSIMGYAKESLPAESRSALAAKAAAVLTLNTLSFCR